MTDIEISKALALAIGWQAHDIEASGQRVYVCYEVATFTYPALWRVFDYRDPAVIWPISKACEGFPTKGNDGLWSVSWFGPPADTPEKAVALAVIGGDEAK